MKKEKTENKEKKVKEKIDGKKLFAKIIAFLMLIMLLTGSLYSLIYLLINA